LAETKGPVAVKRVASDADRGIVDTKSLIVKETRSGRKQLYGVLRGVLRVTELEW